MKNDVYDICIIGAGASGLVAAIESSRRGLSCVVADKNKKPGNKLYATGNGKCNLTNDDWEEDTYYENVFADDVFEVLYKSTGMRQRSFVVDYFNKLGVQIMNKNGYIYPSSQQASTVVWALTEAAKYHGARIINKATVFSVEREDEHVYKVMLNVLRDNEETEHFLLAKNIIIATGGFSQERLGATNPVLSEELLGSLRVPRSNYECALCPVYLNEDVSSLSGIRTKARLSVKGHSELGELQITDQGISGIVTFNLSYYMHSGDEVKINLLPKKSEDEFADEFNKVKYHYPDMRLDQFVNGYINDKLAVYMIRKFYGIPDISLTLKEVTETGARGLYQEITEWKVIVRSKAGFDMSQASAGGITTSYINPYTMMISPERTLGEGIYAVGEATDVLGKCGGYNLTFAFVTGYIAGNAV